MASRFGPHASVVIDGERVRMTDGMEAVPDTGGWMPTGRVSLSHRRLHLCQSARQRVLDAMGVAGSDIRYDLRRAGLL